jgi:hypothetical protein
MEPLNAPAMNPRGRLERSVRVQAEPKPALDALGGPPSPAQMFAECIVIADLTSGCSGAAERKSSTGYDRTLELTLGS